MKDDRERLRDILEAIERIQRYASRGRDAFLTDELLQTWVVHHVQIIGEAARQISETLKATHPEIPWPAIVAMRHVLVHQYFDVDPEEVWITVDRDIPDLKHKLDLIISAPS